MGAWKGKEAPRPSLDEASSQQNQDGQRGQSYVTGCMLHIAEPAKQTCPRLLKP